MMTYSVAPHLNPDPADAVPKIKKIDHAPQQGKSVELAGSGVTSVFPSRLETNVGSKRGPNWLAGFLYWLRRKEKGRSRLAGFSVIRSRLIVSSWLSYWVAPSAAARSGPCKFSAYNVTNVQAQMLHCTGSCSNCPAVKQRHICIH